ncbi:hypothetical protein BDQ17DRAFT_1426107 [Cyathus striatus]|nr:hypothetical protein BDQ17DRAFT_1426107 [Cyathus striatus]
MDFLVVIPDSTAAALIESTVVPELVVQPCAVTPVTSAPPLLDEEQEDPTYLFPIPVLSPPTSIPPGNHNAYPFGGLLASKRHAYGSEAIHHRQ